MTPLKLKLYKTDRSSCVFKNIDTHDRYISLIDCSINYC